MPFEFSLRQAKPGFGASTEPGGPHLVIPKPDAQSYTRFLTTVGVFLCIVGVIAPALILRETAVLRVPSKELAGLTSVARKEIERRQRVSRTAGIYAPYVGVGLFVSGLVMIGFAVPRLRKQEGVSDQLSAAQLKRALAPQDPNQRAAKLTREVREQVESVEPQPPGEDEGEPVEREREPSASQEPVEREEQVPAGAMPGATREDGTADAGNAVPSESDGARLIDMTTVSRLMLAEELERRLFSRLHQITPPHYELQLKVSLRHATRRDLELDAVLFTEIDWLPDVVIKIQLYVVPEAISRGLAPAESSALSLQREYAGGTGRDALAWLIAVADEATPVDILDDAMRANRYEIGSDTLAVSVLTWADSEMCRQVRLIGPPSCGHRRRCLRGCGRG
jgi:hypothetical protein